MKRKKNNHLAEGEITGHYHKVTGNGVEVYEDAYKDDSLHLIIPDTSEIEHQEHNTVILPPGEYRSGIVLEYDPANEESRQVQD